MALTMPGPSAATSAMASTRPGTLRNRSVSRITASRTTPPAVPAITPSGTPMAAAARVMPTPTSNDSRAPMITRVRMSLPTSSVPNQCAALGACSLLAMFTAPATSSG